MSVVKVDSSNNGNFTGKKLIAPGVYMFEIASAKSKLSNKGSQIVAVELKCTDTGEFMGASVYENIALNPKSEWKLCHLAMAAGISAEDIKNNGIDLDVLVGCRVECDIDVEPSSVGQDGKKYDEKNKVKRFIFDAQA